MHQPPYALRTSTHTPIRALARMHTHTGTYTDRLCAHAHAHAHARASTRHSRVGLGPAERRSQPLPRPTVALLGPASARQPHSKSSDGSSLLRIIRATPSHSGPIRVIRRPPSLSISGSAHRTVQGAAAVPSPCWPSRDCGILSQHPLSRCHGLPWPCADRPACRPGRAPHWPDSIRAVLGRVGPPPAATCPIAG